MSMPEILPPEILTAAEAAWERAQKGQVHTGKIIGSTAIFGALDGAVRGGLGRKVRLALAHWKV